MWNVAWADVYVLCKATSILYLACYYRLFLNFLLVSFVFLQIALGSSPPCPTHLRTSRHSPGWPPLPCHPHPARKEHPVTAPTPPPRVSKPDLSGKRPNNSHARLLIMTAILSMFKKKRKKESLSITHILQTLYRLQSLSLLQTREYKNDYLNDCTTAVSYWVGRDTDPPMTAPYCKEKERTSINVWYIIKECYGQILHFKSI